MSLADELAKLEDLRRRGVLNDAEFNQAKANLLAAPVGAAPPVGGSNIDQHLASQLDEIRYQNDVATLDRAWEIESRNYMWMDKMGRAHIPTPGMGRMVQIGGAIGGAIWTVLAIAITSNAPADGVFGIVRFVFPAFGICFIGGAIWMGGHMKKKGQQYQEAYDRYKEKRRQLTGSTI